MHSDNPQIPSNVVLLSPGFNPSAKKYLILCGKLHSKEGMWLVLALQLLWLTLDFCAIVGLLELKVSETYVLIITLVAFVGLRLKCASVMLSHLVHQVVLLVVCGALGSGLVASFLCECRILRKVIHEDDTVVSDAQLSALSVGLCVSFLVQSVAEIWFISLAVTFYRFCRDNKRHRNRMHGSLIMRNMPNVPFYTPATPVQPALLDMDFYGSRSAPAPKHVSRLSPRSQVQDISFGTPILQKGFPFTPAVQRAAESGKKPTENYVSSPL